MNLPTRVLTRLRFGARRCGAAFARRTGLQTTTGVLRALRVKAALQHRTPKPRGRATLPRSLPSNVIGRKFLLLLELLAALSSTASAVEIGTVEFAGHRYTVCAVRVRQEHLQLFHRDEAGVVYKRFERLAPALQARGQKLVFAMNAGMYQPDFSAQGLFVAGGRELAPLNTGSGYGNFYLKPNGIFAITDTGARILETSEFPQLRERVLLATQSGPLLVRQGKLHPAFKADSTSRLFRNGVGVSSAETALFVITEEPVNFHEFATLFRDRLKCPNALFLDGTVSSLYSAQLNRSDFRMDLGPLIGVTEPATSHP